MTQGCQRMPGIWHPDTPEGSTHEAAQVWDLMAPFGGSGRRSLRWHLPLPAARTPGADFVLHERRWGAIALSKLGYFQQGCSCPSSHGCLLQGGKNPWRHSRFPPSPPWRLHSSGFSSRWGWGAAEGWGDQWKKMPLSGSRLYVRN